MLFLAFVQEIGRAGRDGKSSTSTIYFNKNDIAENRQAISKAMKEYCVLQTCRREFIVRYFGFDYEPMFPIHSCCDNCISACTCEECNNKSVDECTEPSQSSSTSQKDIVLAQSMLKEYFKCENDALKDTHSVPEAVSSLSRKLANDIAKHAVIYRSKEKLMADFPFLKLHYVDNINAILCSIIDQST